MLIGILSDAHGNPYGFSACLRGLVEHGVEQIYFLGDSVGYMPDFTPILDQLKNMNAVCLRGNHEEMLLKNLPLSAYRDQVYRLRNAREKLDEKQRNFIESWRGPAMKEEISGLQFAFFHGSPWAPSTGYIYPDSDLSRFKDLPYDVVFMGHTHRPFWAQVGHLQVINVGSCGLPRDVGNLASCVLYDTETSFNKILRLPFDVDKVISEYGDHMHSAVIECLRRNNSKSAINPNQSQRGK